MHELLRRRLGARTFVVAASERADGDVHPERVAPDELKSRQEASAPGAWTMLDQVHGADVLRLDGDPPWAPTVGVADVLVIRSPERPSAVWAADCAPILLARAHGDAEDGVTLAAVHAGWRGLAGGVLATAVDALGGPVDAAVLGPCIHPCCYEFGDADLAAVAAGVGLPIEAVRGATHAGSTALDVPAAVTGGLAALGVRVDAIGPCTGCDDRWYSHRARRDPQRHALVGWFEPPVRIAARTLD